jgi:Domain of unknown function (DUF3597)
MTVFGNIMSAIFGHGAKAQPAPSPKSPTHGSSAPTASTGPAVAGANAQPAPSQKSPTHGPSTPTASPGPAVTPQPQPDVGAILTQLASRNKEKLDWRRSIVDLMKLLNLDSSLSARKELAKELHYTGNTNDSAAMNVWLHKQVMIKIAENGSKVPDELKR